MHVLIIPSWYFPYGTHEIGGRMSHQLALALREQDIDARILFAEFSPNAPFKKQINFNTEQGIPTWRIGQWFPPKFYSTLIQLWAKKYVNAILDYIAAEGSPDIIHAQSYMAGIVSAELFRLTKIPFIVTERASSFITGEIPSRHLSFIKNCFDTASAITSVSPGLKSYLEKFTRQPIMVIPNFYDPLIFYPDTMIPKYKKFTWVSVGEPAHTKGLDILLKAFSKVKQKFTGISMQLILVDRIRGKKELLSLARELNIEKDITWPGLISQIEVAGILRQSHVLISASRIESFGKTIIEAQACGLPVIATKTDGANYIISSPEQGLLSEINDMDSLAASMEVMYSNYSSYNSEAINSSIESRFKKDTIAHQWIELYNKTAN